MNVGTPGHSMTVIAAYSQILTLSDTSIGRSTTVATAKIYSNL